MTSEELTASFAAMMLAETQHCAGCDAPFSPEHFYDRDGPYTADVPCGLYRLCEECATARFGRIKARLREIVALSEKRSSCDVEHLTSVVSEIATLINGLTRGWHDNNRPPPKPPGSFNRLVRREAETRSL